MSKSEKVIDRKFKIMAVNPCKMHTLYDETNSVLFCAHDRALPYTLEAYRQACIDLKCAPEHIESIELLLERVREYQEDNCKTPDTDTDCEIDRCIGGVGVER